MLWNNINNVGALKTIINYQKVCVQMMQCGSRRIDIVMPVLTLIKWSTRAVYVGVNKAFHSDLFFTLLIPEKLMIE